MKYKLNICKVSNNETTNKTCKTFTQFFSGCCQLKLIPLHGLRKAIAPRPFTQPLTDVDVLFKYSTEMFFCCEETLSFLDSTRHS